MNNAPHNKDEVLSKIVLWLYSQQLDILFSSLLLLFELHGIYKYFERHSALNRVFVFPHKKLYIHNWHSHLFCALPNIFSDKLKRYSTHHTCRHLFLFLHESVLDMFENVNRDDMRLILQVVNDDVFIREDYRTIQYNPLLSIGIFGTVAVDVMEE